MRLLEVVGANKRFGGVVAAAGISLFVEPREILAIVGPNGSGKSTLFDLITGFKKMDSGDVYWQGRRITGLMPHAICRIGIARTFQRLRPFTSMTVVENVMVPLLPRTSSVAAARSQAMTFLEFVGLSGLAEAAGGTLSTGQRKRLEVARAMATRPRVVLMDEPAGGVDPERLRELVALIKRLRDQGAAIVIVEHNMRAVLSLADRMIVLDKGRKIAEGDPASVIAEPQVAEAYLGRAHV